MSRCGVIILAAGGSSRLGRPKQLLEIEGRNLLRRSIATALGSQCRPIFVVLGAQFEQLKEQLASPISGQPITLLHNPIWANGIGSSIRVGIAAAEPLCGAAVLVLCDQPMITGAAIDELVSRRIASGKLICAAAYNGTLGTPAVFDSSLFDELLQLGDDQGGKAIIQRHAADVEAMELPEATFDIDTEADFIRVAKLNSAKKGNRDSTQ